METAFLWAQRSEDPRLQVGCVITDNSMRRILSIGYNGLASGRDKKYIRKGVGNSGCLHAEDNAIAMCDSTVPNKRIFITHAPCEMCAQRIVNAGFSHLYFADHYRDVKGLVIAYNAGIEHEQLKPLAGEMVIK